MNITHPYKVEAVELMDELSGTARALGAVNTVVFQNGQRIGHNTDYTGFRSAMRRDFTGFQQNRVLLLGAGGAGNAVALALVDQGVRELEILDLNRAKAVDLSQRLKALRPTAIVKAVDELRPCGLNGLVNAIPLGMASHPGMGIDPELLDQNTWVADIVYFPLQTELLARAKAHGCAVVTGAGMAVFQAVASFALITGHSCDSARMQRHFDNALKSAASQRALA